MYPNTLTGGERVFICGGAIGGQAHCNGWIGINGTICFDSSFYSIYNEPVL
jgi:hypothetical protein